MMSEPVERIIQHLSRAQQLYQQVCDNQELTQLHALQEWQCQRLLASHQDLYSHKAFRPAMTFFVDELYGPQDFSQRDADIARVIPKMSALLPDQALESLAAALHLNALSLELDIAMYQQLVGRTIDRNSYADAYRACDNRSLRVQQIEYIETLGQELANVVHIKGIGTLLMLSRKPAKLAGVLTLHEFLEKGFKAFKKLGDVNAFLHPIISREKAIMEALFSDQANPLPEGL
ncbi:hypothetical protein LJ739_10905 [Aestuariibacter halophilus]|uniref:DUF8198 domain-containing protein n=1 Tax=Fluctibacter halophilus TaxID=226011 RepID=A0ABS8G996_9ALTE|nr:hypothetical protein [Aestuariibacter halophilus]MCC2616751.1 hypothetical protein [Aestuariibacter halophilus]